MVRRRDPLGHDGCPNAFDNRSGKQKSLEIPIAKAQAQLNYDRRHCKMLIMGSRTFDFLSESFLFDESLIRERFSNIPDIEIVAELKRYRQFCLSVAPEIEAEIFTSPTSNLRLFSGIKH